MIVQHPHPILLGGTVEVPPNKFHKLDSLVASMRKHMADHHGVGIAANQIGSNKRVCLVRQTLMINPTFEPVTEETWIDKEGCLSCGETEDRPHYQVERFKHVLVRYNDLRGGTQHATFHDFDARIVQHEIAHLDGRTIIEDQLKKT